MLHHMKRRRNITHNLGCHGQKFAGRGEWRFWCRRQNHHTTDTTRQWGKMDLSWSTQSYTGFRDVPEIVQVWSRNQWSVLVKFELVQLNHQLVLESRSGYIRVKILHNETIHRAASESVWGKNHSFRGTIGNFCIVEQMWHWPHRISYGKKISLMPLMVWSFFCLLYL